jgi:hypothetical protein
MNWMRHLQGALGAIAVFWLSASSHADDAPVPAPAFNLTTPASRAEAIHTLAREIERIDGDGLIFRAERPEPWRATVERLAAEAGQAKTWDELFTAFRKLDATYPSLHGGVQFNPALLGKKARPLRLPVRFVPEWVRPLMQDVDMVIAYAPGMPDSSAALPPEGSRVTAINGRPIDSWIRENDNFCKFRYTEQCVQEFQRNLEGGLLSWQPGEELAFSVRGFARPFRVPLQPAPAGRQSVPMSDQQHACARGPGFYREFAPAWIGLNLCAHTWRRDPSTVLLRVESFFYRDGDRYKLAKEEAQAFFLGWWARHGSAAKRLIIDLSGNGGGDTSVPLAQLVVDKPFRPLHAVFRNIPELKQPAVQDELAWGQAALERWFATQVPRMAGVNEQAADFLPPVAEFCTPQDHLCGDHPFQPRDHGFRGQVFLVTDRGCISACSHFAWLLHRYLSSPPIVVGLTESADTGYARLAIHANLDADGRFRVWTGPHRPPRKGVFTLLRQTAVVTRSVEADGGLRSGRPVPVDAPVARHWRQTDQEWVGQALDAVLRHPPPSSSAPASATVPSTTR